MVERLIEAISDAELARRWAAAERVMHDERLDALVVQNSNDWLGGYVRWFTGVPANNAYPRTVIFFGSGDMTVIEMGDRGTILAPEASDQMWRGVREVAFNPSFSSIGGSLAVDGRPGGSAGSTRTASTSASPGRSRRACPQRCSSTRPCRST